MIYLQTAYSYYYDDEAGAAKKESQPLIEGVYQQGDKKDAADIHVYGAADKDIDIHVYGAAGKDEKVRFLTLIFMLFIFFLILDANKIQF